MKTEELIALLAADTVPAVRGAESRRFVLALCLGMAGALVLMLASYGIRADLGRALGASIFWTKLAFAGSLALAGLVATRRLGHPGVRLGRVKLALAAPVLVLWLIAVSVLVTAAPAQRPELLLGQTWNTCPFNIALISLPLFAATLWALKGLAPTRPALAGASAGLLAGALATLVYALHCPESAAPFVGVWYLLGIAIPTLAGVVVGPRFLRW